MGNRNEGQGDIIHAEGVGGGFRHPRRRRVGSLAPLRGCGEERNGLGLPCLGEAFDLVAQMLEIARTDA
jgi:hypothetical protein